MDEAEFLFYLWNMISEEEIHCRELKEIIVLLKSKRKNELCFILTQQYQDEQKVKKLVNSWINLTNTQHFYQQTEQN